MTLFPDDKRNTIFQGDTIVGMQLLPDDCVHMAVTSPPYWEQRDYKSEGQIGNEPTLEAYVANLVAVFAEVRRVLRDDGVFWLNIGDKMDGELLGMPWRVAFALQADGWHLRSDTIWSKANPMPESVNGWRWERCRVKVKNISVEKTKWKKNKLTNQPMSTGQHHEVEWADCPGCPKCEPHGGYVLRRGSWRPTKAHEYLFLLTKTDRYYGDREAVIEQGTIPAGTLGAKGSAERQAEPGVNARPPEYKEYDGTRNKRDVWNINLRSYKGAHFAVYPAELIEPCILSGTSAKGCCPACGAPWVRQVASERVATRPGENTKTTGVEDDVKGNRDPERHCTTTKTLGWLSSCTCGRKDTIPSIVLDPFMGSGTTAAVAKMHCRDYYGCELNPAYVKLAEDRIRKRRRRIAFSF